MSRPINGADRGYDGWYQAVEIDKRYQDICIGSSVAWQSCRWRIVGISRIKPEIEGNAVVRLEIAGQRH